MKPAAGWRSSVQTQCPTRLRIRYAGRLTKFWAPVPWMLEAAIVLEMVLGKYVEAAIIAVCWSSTLLSGSSRKDAPRQRLPR